MVLLDLLTCVRAAFGISLSVGHVDHGIRPESAQDAAFVVAHASSLGLPVFVRQTDCPALVRATHGSLEEVARTERSRLLKEMAAQAGAKIVATGHTATDQAETVLMRLVRGTGPLGLSGIEARRADGFVRPIMCLTRREVRTYAARHRLQCLQDSTNMDQRYLRNRIRLRLLPMLRRMNPRIEFLLSDLAQDVRGLAQLVREQARSGLVVEKDAVRILQNGNDGWMPYRILAAFEALTGAPLGLSRTHVDSVAGLTETGKRVALPRGISARKERCGVSLVRKDSKRN